MQGLSKMVRRQRATTFGPNHASQVFPPKLTDKTICQVLEDGEWVRVHPRTLVPGDILLLRPDSYVPADGATRFKLCTFSILSHVVC
jgi:magnesium-transporting ATPase (P-type)